MRDDITNATDQQLLDAVCAESEFEGRTAPSIMLGKVGRSKRPDLRQVVPHSCGTPPGRWTGKREDHERSAAGRHASRQPQAGTLRERPPEHTQALLQPGCGITGSPESPS